MIYIRKSSERGSGKTDWLHSFHTFSFAEYHDPQFMGFGSLRVINEDVIQPSTGFGKHPHNNMEIITYVVEGSLEHQDSMGTGSVIRPGEIQRMSAGTGVQHSEVNPSDQHPLHLLQIWIIPEKRNIDPSYQQIKIQKAANQFVLIGANQEKEHTVMIHQDVNLYVAYLTPNHEIDYPLASDRMGWLQLIKGKIKLNNHNMSAGDGAAIEGESLNIQCEEDAELLFFDLKK